MRQTENIDARFGAPSLMVAKFIPGFGAIATALSDAPVRDAVAGAR